MSYLSKKFLNELKQQQRNLFESVKVKDSFIDIKQGKKYDIFLSYSFSDKDYAITIYKLLINCGFTVYIDIGDKQLDRDDVDEQTARRIALIMNNCSCLIYVHTASAKVSKWCPWELGYMSGKTNFRCCIIPLLEDKEDFPHQEYLGLYPIVDYEKGVEDGRYKFWANVYNTDKYVSLKAFIQGKNPYIHKEN